MGKMRAMSSRRLHAWLFALTLLFGQVAAFAHAIDHLHAHDGALPDKVCEVCIAQANLGSAAPATVSVLPIETARPVSVSVPWLQPAAALLHVAQARAPPSTI
jgi:hypothetical protein